MIKEEFFPTIIYGFDVKLDNDKLAQDILEWSKHDKGVHKTNVQGWHSHTHMQTNPTYKPLVDQLFLAMKQVWDDQHLDRDFGIGNMCANINPPGAYNKSHNHANALFSGVYYVKVPNNKEATSGYLELFEPRPGPLIIRPRQNDKDLPNVYWKKVSYNPVQGRIIVFPAWLWHEVHTNNTKESRISVSFNFIQR